MNKKNIFYLIIFIILSAGSVVFIGHLSGFSLKELFMQVQSVEISWILLAVLATALFVFSEGKALNILVTELSPNKPKHIRGNLYASADIYFSAITPSATGGQPASALFMIKDGIPVAVTTVVLLLNLFMYFVSLFICGILSLIFSYNLFFEYKIIAKTFIIIGMCILIFCMVFFAIALNHKGWIEKIFGFLIDLGGKLHIIRHPEKRHERLTHTVEQYAACSQSIVGKRRMLVKVFLLNLIQRLSRGLVFVLCYMALGGSTQNIVDVWSVSTFAALGANLLPIPGGIGSIEYILLEGYKTVNDISSAANMTFLGRGISFYGCIIISVIILCVGYFLHYRKKAMEG